MDLDSCQRADWTGINKGFARWALEGIVNLYVEILMKAEPDGILKLYEGF